MISVVSFVGNNIHWKRITRRSVPKNAQIFTRKRERKFLKIILTIDPI
jgi:hypothetical protein